MPDETIKHSLTETSLKEALVEVLGGDDGSTPISARLLSNPAGTSDYYEDTRTPEGRLKLGKKVDYVE